MGVGVAGGGSDAGCREELLTGKVAIFGSLSAWGKIQLWILSWGWAIRKEETPPKMKMLKKNVGFIMRKGYLEARRFLTQKCLSVSS